MASEELDGGKGEKDYLSLSKLKKRYQDYASNKREEREEAESSRRYYHGDQWTSAEIAVLNSRKQPVIWDNQIQPMVDGVVGLIERLRQDPKAYPRSPKHEEGAEIATSVLNYVLDQNNWNALTPDLVRDAAIEPVVGIELSIEEGDNGDKDVKLEAFEPDDFFYDPRSRKEDLSDARYMGIAKWVDLDVAQAMFPDREDELEDLVTSGDSIDMSDRIDGKQVWVNCSEKRIFLVEHWYQKGTQWLFCFYTGGTKLLEGKSPYVDQKGRSMCRYVAFSTSVDHDGDRYGITRNMKPLQDEVNHRRSKGVHLLNTKRIYVTQGTVDDIEALRDEAHKPDAIMVLPPGATWDERSNAEQAAGNLEMMQEAKGALSKFGPQPALQGATANDQSGRAIALLQQAALAQLGPFILAYRGWKIRVYRAIWNIVQTTWDSERWIRVTDDEGLAEFLAVNQLTQDEFGQPILVNALGNLDVDIIVDEGQDNITLMQDVFESLTRLASAGIPIPPQVMIELADLPASQKKKLLGYLEQAQQPDPMAAKAAEIELAGGAAKVEETQARAKKLMAETAKTAMDADQSIAKTDKTVADTEATLTDTALKFLAPEPIAPGLIEQGYLR